jgi:hypothetical protein
LLVASLIGHVVPAAGSRRVRPLWPAAHDVRYHNIGIEHFHHPVVGDVSLSLTRLDLSADPGLTIFTYAAEPGWRSEEALKLLGRRAATADPAESVHAIDQS